MRLNIKKLQQGNTIDNPNTINFFKASPDKLKEFAQFMNTDSVKALKLISDNKPGKFHTTADKFVTPPIVNKPTTIQADSLDYVNPRTKAIVRTNSVDFTNKFKPHVDNFIKVGYTPEQSLHKTYDLFNARFLGKSKLRIPITQ